MPKKTPEPLPTLLTTKEVMAQLKVSRKSLWVLRKKDPRFPKTAIPWPLRWREIDIANYLNNNETA